MSVDIFYLLLLIRTLGLSKFFVKLLKFSGVFDHRSITQCHGILKTEVSTEFFDRMFVLNFRDLTDQIDIPASTSILREETVNPASTF